MDRVTFQDFLHETFNMTDDILMDRMFKFFDSRGGGLISREEWVMGLNVLLKGGLQEQLSYTFSIYDLNHDGFITRELAGSKWSLIICPLGVMPFGLDLF